MNYLRESVAKLFNLRENLPYSTSGQGNIDDAENIGWTPLTVGGKDLPTFQTDRMQAIAVHLYRRNAIAHRIIEVMKAFVVGEGIIVKAKDPDVDRIVQRFWKDRRNNWRKYLRERVISLSLYGEALYPAYVNQINGAVQLGATHPSIIEQLLPNIRNVYEVEQIITKEGKDASGESVPKQIFQAIKVNTDPDDPSFLKYWGDMFFFAINKTHDGLRGVSDLYAIADWIDIYDQFVFNRAQRQSYMSQFLWDIEIQGAGPNELEKKMADLILSERKQRSGRFYLHNEKEQRKPMSPDLQADDATQDATTFMHMIWGGSGLSSQAFGDPGGGRQAGGDVNEWVFKTLADRQYIWRDILLEIFDFVLDQAELHGEKISDKNRDIEIFMPKISMRDLQRLTQSLRNLGGFVNQVSRAESVLTLDSNDQSRIKAVLHTLLDHIDQSSGIEFLHDVETKNEPEQKDVDKEEEEREVESLRQAVMITNNSNGHTEQDKVGEPREYSMPYSYDLVTSEEG